MPRKTWARLADGTPLVTAARRGKGLIVLFHVDGDTTWSNLPISGSSSTCCARIVARAGAGAPADGVSGRRRRTTRRRARPTARSTASARLGAPPATPRRSAPISRGPADAEHPPGFYGPAGRSKRSTRSAPSESSAPADFAGSGARPGGLDARRAARPEARAAAAAFIALLVDGARLLVARRRAALRPGRRAALLMAAALRSAPPRAHAPARADARATGFRQRDAKRRSTRTSPMS